MPASYAGHSSGVSTSLCVSESVVQMPGPVHPSGSGAAEGSLEAQPAGWPAPACPGLPPSGHTGRSCGARAFLTPVAGRPPPWPHTEVRLC